MSEEYLDYVPPQYLGKSGITLRCRLAMAAILTSAFKPEKITAVIGPRKGSSRVLFLVWNWIYSEVTIIADGFGTHGGEGGAGLSAVLGLIKFYKIPLFQARLDNQELFQELAEGHLTEEIFDAVVADEQAYNWKFYYVSEVKKEKKDNKQVLEVYWYGKEDWTIPLPSR